MIITLKEVRGWIGGENPGLANIFGAGSSSAASNSNLSRIGKTPPLSYIGRGTLNKGSTNRSNFLALENVMYEIFV